MMVVVDTNVLVSGLLLPDSIPGRIVRAWRDRQFELVVSAELVEETERVLHCPKIRRRLGWSEDTIARFVSLLRYKTIAVALDESRPPDEPELRDADDLAVLHTFTAGEADIIVSGDGDLLALSVKYPIEAPSTFVQRL